MNTLNMGNVDLIAEIGGNHEGDFDYAKRLNNLAIKSEADVIKYQLYTGGTIANRRIDPERYEHFRKFELTKEQHMELAVECLDAGKEYLASVWDLEFLNYMDPVLKRYKIGSGDLTNKLLLNEFCRRKKPIILSTGLATFLEVENAIEFIRSCDPFYLTKGSIFVMQCTSMYPINDSDANLAVLNSISTIPNIIPGYSDHTTGLDALVYSVALGAKILEFHFTDDRDGKTFRDHAVSLTTSEVTELKNRLNKLDEYHGAGIKVPLQIELENNHLKTFRRAIYFNRDMKAGEEVRYTDLVALRPNEGISAWDIELVVGKKCKVEIPALASLSHDMFGGRDEDNS